MPVYTRPSALRPTSPNWPADIAQNAHQGSIWQHYKASAVSTDQSGFHCRCRQCPPRLKLLVAVRGPVMATSMPSNRSSAASLLVRVGSSTGVGVGGALPDLQRS